MEQAYTEIIFALMAEKIKELQDRLFSSEMEIKMLKREKEDLCVLVKEFALKDEQTFAVSEVDHERGQMGENHDGYV